MSKARDVADSYTDVEVDAKDATLQTQVNDRYTKSESDGRYLQNGDAITSNNGNVGIGTSSPTYPLHVQGQVGIELYNTTGGGNALNFRPSLGDANKYNLSITSYDHSADGTAHADGLSINGYDGVSFCTGSNSRQERMRIDSEGRVTMPYQPMVNCGIRDHNTSNTHAGSGISALYAKSASEGGLVQGGMRLSSDRITVPVSGKYLVVANQLNQSNGGEYFSIRKNGATLHFGYNNDSGALHDLNSSVIATLSANDYIQISYSSTTSNRWEGAHANLCIYLIG